MNLDVLPAGCSSHPGARHFVCGFVDTCPGRHLELTSLSQLLAWVVGGQPWPLSVSLRISLGGRTLSTANGGGAVWAGTESGGHRIP